MFLVAPEMDIMSLGAKSLAKAPLMPESQSIVLDGSVTQG